jgi:hypothetical protein
MGHPDGAHTHGGSLDLTGLLGLAVLVGAGAAVMLFILEFIWYIVAILTMAAAGFVIGGLTVRRKIRAHAAMLEATRPARLAAATARAQVPAAVPLAVEQHVHYHYHAAPDSPARIVVRGTAEDAIAEENLQP